MSANAPQARDSGYKHVEVDIERQVLLLTDDDGEVIRVLPISSGSNKQYKEKTMSGLAYTPRGRFRIIAKFQLVRKSPLGLLYYPVTSVAAWRFTEILQYLTNRRVTAAFAFRCPRRWK